MIPLLLLPLLLLPVQAAAATTTVHAIPWAEVGLAPAVPEAPARGPEQLAACPDGSLALVDPVLREVVLVEQGAVALSFPVPRATDLLCTEHGLVVLDHAARTLALWDRGGALLDAAGLPELVPTGVTLARVGDALVALDLFGNRHAAATLAPGGLLPPAHDGLEEIAGGVRWDGSAMHVDQHRVPVPGALRASGQLAGDWLVVDAVVGDRPLAVERRAVHLPTGAAVPLPVEGRLYAPRGDHAADHRGGLWVVVPTGAALELWEVRP